MRVVTTRPVGQAVKTLASHAGNMGSIPVRVTSGKLPLPIIGGVHRYDKLNTAVVWFGFISDRFTKRNKSEPVRKSKPVRICFYYNYPDLYRLCNNFGFTPAFIAEPVIVSP